MRRTLTALSAVVIALTAPGLAPAVHAAPATSPVVRTAADCTNLAKLTTYRITGTTAHVDTANATKDGKTCDVTGHVDPKVAFEAKLPLASFTGSYVQYGCMGHCGVISGTDQPACSPPQGGDFAVAATNDGHIGVDPFAPIFDGRWGADDQSARNDYFYRAPHVVALAAKRLIAIFYGTAPRRSYFDGCSTGGREGLLLAQRYPHDFNGIVAGDPVNYLSPLMGMYMPWAIRTNTDAHGAAILTFDKLPALHAAVMNACDGLDGLKDGQIDDPTACHYDPAAMQCPPNADQPTCLTQAQVATARKLYAGPYDEDGRRLFPGGQPYGSEGFWAGAIVPEPQHHGTYKPLPDNYLRYLGYPIGTPASSVDTAQFTAAEFRRQTTEGVLGNAMNLDLSAFRKAGGKLIIWHGWADQSVPPTQTLDYYQRLWEHNGGLRATQHFARLYMVPTIIHCALFGGGYELTNFDPFPALVSWVESGHAPNGIIASRVEADKTTTRTRPVFPYPERAVYTGHGSIDDANNFVAAPPLTAPHNVVHWLGDDLYGKKGPVAP